MSDKRYLGNIITQNPTAPAGNFEGSAAKGVWSLEEQLAYQKAGLWPVPGNTPLDITDVFSTNLYKGTGAAQVIENGIKLAQSNAGGSVDFSGADTVRMNVPSSSDFGYGTGDYTIEFFVYSYSYKNYTTYYDQRTASQGASTASPFLYADSGGTLYFYLDGDNRITGSGSNIVNSAWTHVALCRASSQTRLFVNGTQIGSTYSDSTNYLTPASNWSVGGSLEQNLYNVEGHMSNVRVIKGSALYTSNFTTPTAELTAVSGTVLLALQGDEPFTDNSSSGHSLVNNGASASKFGPFDAATAGEGGLVWVKKRNASKNHGLMDTERGLDGSSNSRYLKSNTNDAQTTGGLITAYNSTGFTLGTAGITNTLNDYYASWTFRKAPKFFTCLTYTGNSTNRTISHDLGSVPGMIIVKRIDNPDNWFVYHRSLGPTKGLMLNKTFAEFTAGYWQNTTPTATEFSIFDDDTVNANGGTYVAYIFAHNDGDGGFGPDNSDIIKCGSWTGSGSSGTQVDLGFEPQWVMIKQTSGSSESGWQIFDVMRGMDAEVNTRLLANEDGAESSFTSGNIPVALNATGFKINNSYYYDSGSTFIYMAIRRGPLAAPTAGTEVFAIDNQTASSAPFLTSNFPVDMVIRKDTAGSNSEVMSRLTQGKGLFANATSAEQTDSVAQFDFNDGCLDGTSTDTSRYGWMWKRAPGYFDAVAFTSQASGSTKSFSHNLTVAPEMIWLKNRPNSDPWLVYHSALGLNKYLVLDTTAAEATEASWISTPSATEVTGIKDNMTYNDSTYIAYLFASLAGVSKVGSYTGNGSSQTIDCGFTSGARFVLIKRAVGGSGGWYVWDSVRGIVAGNDPFLALNNTNAETTSVDLVDPASSGFAVNYNVDWSFNLTGNTYIFYAIA